MNSKSLTLFIYATAIPLNNELSNPRFFNFCIELFKTVHSKNDSIKQIMKSANCYHLIKSAFLINTELLPLS